MIHGAQAVRGWRNLPLVREHDVRHTRRLLGWMGGVLIALTPFVVYLLQQIEYVHVRYRIEEVRAQHDRLMEAERRLRMERATVEALPRVEAQARHEDLVHPTPDGVVMVRRVRSGGRARAPDAFPATAR